MEDLPKSCLEVAQLFQENEIIESTRDGKEVILGNSGDRGNSLQEGIWAKVKGMPGGSKFSALPQPLHQANIPISKICEYWYFLLQRTPLVILIIIHQVISFYYIKQVLAHVDFIFP